MFSIARREKAGESRSVLSFIDGVAGRNRMKLMLAIVINRLAANACPGA